MNKNLLFSHIDYDKPQEDKTVQAISDKYAVGDNEHFFNHKKKKWIMLWSILFVLIIVIVIKLLLNISFIEFFRILASKGDVPFMAGTMIIGFATFFVCEIFVRVKVIKVKLQTRTSHITKFEWFSFSVISFFIQSITPFSIGSEPYSIWWLNKRGVPIKEASAVVAVTSICWFAGQFLITWPAFIYMTVQNYEQISNLTITKTYWLVLVGLIVDLSVFVFIFVISYVKKAHYWISRMVNRIKRRLGLSYATEDELFRKYLNDSNFREIYVRSLFHKSTLHVLFWFLLNNLWVYFLFVIVHRLFNYNTWTVESAVNSYNLINVSTTATNFVPIPSSEGSLQKIIDDLIKGMPARGAEVGETGYSEETIFLWRFFCKYFGLMIGLGFIIMFGFNTRSKSFLKIKRNKLKSQNVHELIF